jgi:hypothetical protein
MDMEWSLHSDQWGVEGGGEGREDNTLQKYMRVWTPLSSSYELVVLPRVKHHGIVLVYLVVLVTNTCSEVVLMTITNYNAESLCLMYLVVLVTNT